MRKVNEVPAVTEAVMRVVQRQWPDHELPTTLTGEIRTAIQTVLANQPDGTFTPSELARRWGISPDKVLNWIRKGDLKAINVASSPNVRPRYRIPGDAIDDFQLRRQPIPRTPNVQSRRAQRDVDVIEFY